MVGDLIEQIEGALLYNKKQIACFWEFVEAQSLQPLRSDSDMQQAVFAFLVGENDPHYNLSPGTPA